MSLKDRHKIGAMYEAGENITIIAKKFGVKPRDIQPISYALNYRRNVRGISLQQAKINLRNKKIYDEYYVVGRSANDIGKEYSLSPERIRQILIKLGGSERHYGINMPRSKNMREREIQQKKIRDEKKRKYEERAIAIRAMYDAGKYTYDEIAKAFNVETTAVTRDLWKTGGPNRRITAGRAKKILSPADEEEIIRRYQSREGVPAIAAAFNMKQENLKAFLYKRKIKRSSETK